MFDELILELTQEQLEQASWDEYVAQYEDIYREEH